MPHVDFFSSRELLLVYLFYGLATEDLHDRMHPRDAWHGLSVMRELEKPDSKTPHIVPELKKRLKHTIKAFENAYGKKKRSDLERSFKEENYWEDWTPILSSYEASFDSILLWIYRLSGNRYLTTERCCPQLYKGHALSNSDMGGLVFAHKSKRKFILVNLCGSRQSRECCYLLCVSSPADKTLFCS